MWKTIFQFKYVLYRIIKIIFGNISNKCWQCIETEIALKHETMKVMKVDINFIDNIMDTFVALYYHNYF